MRKENVRCPMCGTMNYDVDLDATDGWTKCHLCKAVTCSMRQQLLPNCWLTPLWLHSLKILQRTYKPLYINSGSFPYMESCRYLF